MLLRGWKLYNYVTAVTVNRKKTQKQKKKTDSSIGNRHVSYLSYRNIDDTSYVFQWSDEILLDSKVITTFVFVAKNLRRYTLHYYRVTSRLAVLQFSPGRRNKYIMANVCTYNTRRKHIPQRDWHDTYFSVRHQNSFQHGPFSLIPNRNPFRKIINLLIVHASISHAIFPHFSVRSRGTRTTNTPRKTKLYFYVHNTRTRRV